MPRLLKHALSLWFILQIVLPFTAPLQTCDLRDLLGVQDHHTVPVSPESSTTPTIAEAHANTFAAPPVEAAMLHAATALVAGDDQLVGGLLVSASALSPAQVQRGVLRL
jgi:hypothetical protein